jgi:uncharacterized protein GlcG (DUF336 family)
LPRRRPAPPDSSTCRRATSGSFHNRAIEHSNGGLITFPGGLPIKDRTNTIIGAIGVSGDAVENDHAVAQAGATAAVI